MPFKAKSKHSSQHKSKQTQQLCHVCNQNTIRCIRYGAESCNSCANFFLKYELNRMERPAKCCCHKNRLTKCSKCKYERCLQLGMRLKNYPSKAAKRQHFMEQQQQQQKRQMRQELKMTMMSNGNGNYNYSNDESEATGDLASDDEKKIARLTKSNPYLSKSFLKVLKRNQHLPMEQQQQQQMAKQPKSEEGGGGGDEDEEFRSIEIVLNKENAAKLVAELQCKIECANRENLEDIKFTFYL